MTKLLYILGAVALFSAATIMMMDKPVHHEAKHLNEQDQEVMGLWKNFKMTHNKKYSHAQEEMYRFQVFLDNLNFINNNQGETYTLGVTSLADLTAEEFRATYLGFTPELSTVEEEEFTVATDAPSAPASVNWVTAGVVPAILNQASCGSCWAFSAAGAISMAYNVKNKNNSLQLSPEQLVQCSKAYGNNGCNGGLMNNAFNYVKQYPLCTLAQYPYSSGNGVTGNCNTTLQSQGKYTVTGYTNVPKTTAGMQNAIAIEPVSIAVDAANWQHYTGGIFNNCKANLDHGVIAVGYTATYWYVRNSWGTGWGQQGYIQLAMGNTCGLLNSASYPSV